MLHPFYKMFLEATATLTFSSYSALAPCSPVYLHLIEMMWWLTDPANFSYASSFLTCLWLTEEKTLFSNSPVLLRTNFTKTFLLRRRTTNVMLSQLLTAERIITAIGCWCYTPVAMFLFAYVGSAKNCGSRISSFFIFVFGTFPSSRFFFCALYRYGVENARTTIRFYSSTDL